MISPPLATPTRQVPTTATQYADIGALQPQRVLDWYAGAARDLPWRHSGVSAWAVMVSEVMLQQTPVVRVLPMWTAWMARWPSPAALADDSPAEAVRAWGKLGYPRRAMRLHAAAQQVVTRFAGNVPSAVEDLESLPGIGAYTARAVAAFAFSARTPVVDTNVGRVLARAVHGRAQAGPSVAAADRAKMELLLPAEPARAAVFSVAVMELGALVCTAAAPDCPACPIRPDCAWQLAGAPAHAGPRRRSQRFEGTDRQVRGLLLDVLRTTSEPVSIGDLDGAWADGAQRNRALDSLLLDGLVGQLTDGRFVLAGERTDTSPAIMEL
ncbi:MAG: A/G-specific adenine glycosylase [Geodermatophilaceae bacterium]|nr:A/G-specific adenine glycosylase [Geodermatophilaceae bacterium]